jgi:hypothetical protein
VRAHIKAPTSTRRWWKLSTAFAAAAAVLLIASGAGAAASHQQPLQMPPDPRTPPGLPALGTEFRLPVKVQGWELEFADSPSTPSAAEQDVEEPDLYGEIVLKVGEDGRLTESVIGVLALLTISRTTNPGDHESHQDGTAPLEQDAPSYRVELDDQWLTPLSVLSPVVTGSDAWEHAMSLGLKVTITNPPAAWARTAGVEQSEPIVLATKQPAVLVGALDSFPPRGDVYQLKNPVELVFAHDPGTPIGKLEKLPLTIGTL